MEKVQILKDSLRTAVRPELQSLNEVNSVCVREQRLKRCTSEFKMKSKSCQEKIAYSSYYK